MKLNKGFWITWAVSSLAVVMFVVASISIAFSTQRVQYGLDFDMNYINTVEVWSNPDRGFVAYVDLLPERIMQNQAVHQVMTELNRAHSTNRLAQIFQASGENVSVGWNTGGNNSTDQIIRNNNGLFIKINFRVPQFGIAGTGASGNPHRIVPAAQAESATMRIHQIFIPLGNQTNSWQAQDWFVNINESPNDRIDFRIQTFGNYWALANLVRDLHVFR
ncbi:MAG: hypothetical protein FWE38_02265 [Firmicutes bacterium]|nr:hypothetical protein [Bacillota bacterium]